MQFQFDVTSTTPPPAEAELSPQELLRQILLTQREHLAHAKAIAAANDHGARWRALLVRWKQEFPELPATCKEVLPSLEKAYGALIERVVEELREQGEDALDTDFALQDFLDRYGMRLGQLGHILNLVGPLADAATQNEEGAPQEKP